MKQSLFRLSRSFLFLFFGILICTCSKLHAQSAATVSGTITDAETQEPLPGVNVIEKNTSNGTTTNFDGAFILRPITMAREKASIQRYQMFLLQTLPVKKLPELQ